MSSHTTLRFVATVDLAVASTAVEGSMRAGSDSRRPLEKTRGHRLRRRPLLKTLSAISFRVRLHALLRLRLNAF